MTEDRLEVAGNGVRPQRARRSDAIENEAKVLAGAARVFERRGNALSMEEVAVEAHVSKGTVYNVFGSRDAMVGRLTVGYLQQCASMLAEAQCASDPWEGLKRALLTPTMGIAVDSDLLASAGVTSPVERAFADCQSRLRQLLELCQQQGYVRGDIDLSHVNVLFQGLYRVLPRYGARDNDYVLACGQIILRGMECR